MDAFLIMLLLTALIAVGGREQLIVAQFSDQTGRSVELLLIGLACAAASGAIAAWAGLSIAAMLPWRAAQMLVALALVFAAIELAWPVRLKSMKEPTRSYVAIGAVLFLRQLMDAPRFVVFALAAFVVYPLAGLPGAALGGMASVALGWSIGKARLERFPLYYLRLGMAACSIVAALFIGLNARFAPL